MKSSILVVARHADRRAMLARRLMGAGYAVELSEEPARARELAHAGDVRLAVLAPGDFGAAGADLVRQLRDSLGDVILLDDGDEGSLDLLERVRSALRPPVESRPHEPEVLRFEGWHLDVPARSLRRDNGPEISLTRSEFDLLLTFLRHAGWVLSRDQLRNSVAGKSVEAYERSVDMMVDRLRRKLETDPKRPRLIIAVAGVGYRFAVKPQVLTEAIAALDARPDPGEPAKPGSGCSRSRAACWSVDRLRSSHASSSFQVRNPRGSTPKTCRMRSLPAGAVVAMWLAIPAAW
jgi:DNA-binding response OmpR family regulator